MLLVWTGVFCQEATRLPGERAWCTSRSSLRPFAHASECSAAHWMHSLPPGMTREAACTRAGFGLCSFAEVEVTVACLLYLRTWAGLLWAPCRSVGCAGLALGLLRCPAKARGQDCSAKRDIAVGCPRTNSQARLTLEHPQSGAAVATDQTKVVTTDLQSTPVTLLPCPILCVLPIHSGQPELQKLPGGAMHRRMALTMGCRRTEQLHQSSH